MSTSTLNDALSPPEDMPPIRLIDWPAGTGKTRAVIKDVVRAVRDGYKVIWATPTVGVLQAETHARLTGENAIDELGEYLADDDVYVFNATLREEEGYHDIGSMIAQEVLRDIEQAPDEGRVFLCSWVGFLAASQLRSSGKFKAFPKTRLIIDEVPEVLAFTFYQSNDVDFTDYLTFKDKLVKPLKEQQSHWEAVAKGVSNNSVFEHGRLKELAALLVHPDYITTVAKHRKQAQLYLTSYLRPNVFQSFKEVEVLGANSQHSLMYLLYAKWGVKFQINTKYSSDMRTTEPLGDLFTIVPIQDLPVTKNAMEKKPKAKWVMERLVSIVREFYGEDRPFIYCVNNGVKLTKMPAHANKTSSMLQGSNDYTAYEAAAFLCSLNPGREFTLDLEERWQIDYGDYLRAKTAEVIYQYSYRIKARLGVRTSGDKYLIVVLDRTSAAALKEKIEGSRVDESYIEVDPEQKHTGNAGGGITGFLKVTPAESKRLRDWRTVVAESQKVNVSVTVQEALSTTGATRYNGLLDMAAKYKVSIDDFESILLGAAGLSVFPQPLLTALDHGFTTQ
jgi:hypothetical protein